MTQLQQLRCRQIVEGDFDGLATLLNKAFSCWSHGYWLDGLAHMRDRQSPQGFPRYGFLLESGGRIVGVILTIFTAVGEGEARKVRCNVSSWYVEPEFRGHGSPMISQVFKYKNVTILNVSALVHTWPILKHQGYVRYSEGQMISVPALQLGASGGRVRPYDPSMALRLRDPDEAALMAYHAARGCLSLVCEKDGELVPFVFLKRSISKLRVNYVQLVYCRDTADFVRCAGALGRYLLVRGMPVAVLDAEGPVKGLVGRFVKDRVPKFYRGPDRPRLNDLAYTEAVVLGV
jgi:hypothetical protein